jgi:hypothetical protein
MGRGRLYHLYWRSFDSETYHCFEPVSGKRPGDRNKSYASLCGHHTLAQPYGQALQRPPLNQRCSKCNFAEMQIRGWDEPGPAS